MLHSFFFSVLFYISHAARQVDVRNGCANGDDAFCGWDSKAAPKAGVAFVTFHHFRLMDNLLPSIAAERAVRKWTNRT